MKLRKALLGATLLAAPLAQASAAPDPLPIEDLAAIPFVSEPVLSPDGKRIAAKVNVDGVESLAVYDLIKGAEAEPMIIPGGSSRWFAWAGNDRLLVSTGTTIIFGSFVLPFTRLTRYDVATAKPLDIHVGGGLIGDQVVFTDPAGRYILLAAQKDMTDAPSVYRVDLETGASVEVQKKKSDIWTWFADPSGAIRGGVGYSGNNWSVYTRDPATGVLQRVAKAKVKIDADRESTVDSLALFPASDKGIMVTNERTGRFGVYEYQLGAVEAGAPIFEHPDVDVTKAITFPDSAKVEGVYFEDDRPRYVWFDPELKKLQAQIDKTFPGKVNVISNRSSDGNIVLVASSSADDPGAFYVFDRKAKRMNAFAAPYEKLVDRKLAPVKPVRYTARDGLSVPAYLTLPPGIDAKSLPLIVMPHGGPFHRDSYAFDPWVQMLASRGYAVLQPNFRGSTGYGREHVERGYGEMGLKMQDDLDDGVKWLASDGLIDPKRVCIMGGSYGGYAALWGTVRNPELYRCAISFAGISDVRAILKYNSKLMYSSRYSKQHRRRIEGEEKRDLAAVSPLQQVARLRTPILIAHGEQDVNVPVDQSRKFVTAVRARGGSIVSAFYPAAGHGFTRSEDSADFLRRAEAFLELHNPVDVARPLSAREAEKVSGKIEIADLVRATAKKPAPSGAIEIRYRVTADGRVAGCSVAKASGTAAFDKQACTLAEESFQYRPAVSGAGERIESAQTYTVKWDPPAAPAKKGTR
ncbi:MAG TPA: TonB family protein [Allosphingosinicella sp.]|jgi:TonB family protein